jgi:hypothetical protein
MKTGEGETGLRSEGRGEHNKIHDKIGDDDSCKEQSAEGTEQRDMQT